MAGWEMLYASPVLWYTERYSQTLAPDTACKTVQAGLCLCRSSIRPISMQSLVFIDNPTNCTNSYQLAFIIQLFHTALTTILMRDDSHRTAQIAEHPQTN